MKILYCGDIVGRAGRNVIVKHLAEIKQKYHIDIVIANGENAAHGFGLTPGIADDLLNAGTDGLTTGNHIWQQREIYPYLDQNKKIVRPLNYPENLPGRGWQIIETAGKKALFAQVLGRLFMPPVNSITEPLDNLLKLYTLMRLRLIFTVKPLLKKLPSAIILTDASALLPEPIPMSRPPTQEFFRKKPVILPMSACAATLNLFWVLNLRRRWIGWRKN